MANKYSKAPISELIFGIIFNTPILARNGIIFDLIRELSSGDYPELKTQPAIFEEDYIESRISVNIDYDKSGFVLYRLYTKDGDYLIQLQQNLLLLNWIRKDEVAVGKYPGFSEVFSRFSNIINILRKKFQETDLKNLDFTKQIKNLVLTYNDRVSTSDDDQTLKSYLNLSFPQIPVDEGVIYPNTIATKFISHIPVINGFNSLSINTGHDPQGRRILVIENRIKGRPIIENLEDWFKNAHGIQQIVFENLFTKETLKSWQ